MGLLFQGTVTLNNEAGKESHHRTIFNKKREAIMGQGFFFNEKVLCEECFLKAEDWEVFEGRETPQRKELEANDCQQCGMPLPDIAQPYE